MSWGKDSIFLLYLIRKIIPSIPVVFVNSGFALPDTYRIRDTLVKEWNLNYFEVTQPIDYIDLCHTVGLPHERSKQQQNIAVKILKKNLLDDFAHQNGFDLCFWGIRCDESKGRMNLFKANGFFVKSTLINKCHPIALIKLQELWYLYDEWDVPCNEIYHKTRFLSKYQIRNTGWISTDDAQNGRIQWLKYYYPEHYNKLCKEFPDIRAYV